MLSEAGLRIGQEIVKYAARAWVGHRTTVEVRNAELIDLVAVGVVDQFHRRKLARQWEEIGDQVAQRLLPVLEREAKLPDAECRAALGAVVETLIEADLSDYALFDADVDPMTLARSIRRRMSQAPRRAGLSEAGELLYRRVLDESCVCIVSVVQQLPAFEPRALTELLRRVSDAADQIGRVLERLPRATLDAPRGTDHDAEFTHRYLAYLSETLDVLELYGVDVHRFRPRTSVSLAYLSLSVTGSRRDVPPGRRGGEWDIPSERGLRVEEALGEGKRTLLRGDAGSGKTTLLQWIAINAARHGFTGSLARCNGAIPFVVWLRGHADGELPWPEDMVAAGAGPFAAQMPPGWAHRQFSSGAALLLVDGVDELTSRRRAAVRRWLSRLVAAFPEIEIVITSRPAAAEARWLDGQGFQSLLLEPMTPADVDAFCRRWHDAVRETARNGAELPCTIAELTEYEASLAQQLDSRRHLRALATNPLMCAMLCALNLDRRKYLPADRMQLYAAALEMLIERRDAERAVPTDPALEVASKVALLQYLAWWLTQCGRAELGIEDAVQRVDYALTRMPNLDLDAKSAVRYLVERSGVLRQPRLGRVDFVHRTFQEYLAAKQAAEEHLIDVLIRNAHLDQWRETVVMAAGHATARLRDELLTGMLDRADEEPRRARRLRLISASCLDTAHTVSPEVAARTTAALNALLPPRRKQEARSLALVGERLLRHLPRRLDDLSESAAAACVHAATLISGPEALSTLARYASDPREQVQLELAQAWKYFNPEEFAKKVLAHAPLRYGSITVERSEHLPHLGKLRALRATKLDLRVDRTEDLGALSEVPNLTELRIYPEGPALDLSPLRRYPNLEYLQIVNSPCRGLDVLGELRHLVGLHIRLSRQVSDLEFASNLAQVEHFFFGDCRNIRDVSPLNGLPAASVKLWGCEALNDLSGWTGSSRLTTLGIHAAPLYGGAGALETLISGLEFLTLSACPTVTDLNPLRGTRISTLWLAHCPVTDLAPLGEANELRDLAIDWTEVTDISPVVGLPRLRRIDMRGLSPDLDLRPLQDRPRSPKLEIWLSPGQRARGLGGLGEGVRIKRV
ncbi:NACHT domain-containing protein [Saccharopolyspora phatthalungensis]|uniref:NACHT domain-containing protein n=1 Tax=Saccharopolyspora phatthalungensis TaxID=664693 RepID=A0A840QF53_9PSEU|nr:NACHT domain-containing protein [Saccharopolyspora phatthalungensis]MBB5158687.1 hypothetical protein [Saccharopolyspora phatthalungensis]